MNFLKFIKSYIELCLWLLIFAVGIRFFEAILLSRESYDFTSNLLWNLTGLCYDISLYLRISVCFLVLFVSCCFFSEKTTRIVARILLSLLLFFSLIGILFFATSGFLLDRVVFTYSLKEIWFIIQTSGKSPVWVYIVVIALPVFYFFISNKRIKINNITLIVFAVFTLFSFFICVKPPIHSKQYHIKTNKTYFFWKSVLKNQNASFKKNNEEVFKSVKEFRSFFPEHQFVEMEYPFLYRAASKDVLTPFFNFNSEPPHFVFIIVEGLAYEFFKNDYRLMPFLDALSKRSLVWEHCLSVSARTFGVLPALFGAAPLGEEGFMYQCPNNPDYHSLLRILHQNNYTNRFFYGGWIGFDNTNHFCHQNNMTYLNTDDWEQDIKDESIGISWGYEDHLVYLQALRKLNRVNQSPRVDVYLSYFTHVPFKYPRSSYFQNIVKGKVIQNKTLPDRKKKDILNALDIYGSFAYADWALQQLIEGYQKREDYGNTIFIITGDHHVSSKQFGGYYNYHVPLLIYSPMLQSGRNMKGVVSHRDITPTFLSLLQHNFNIETPKEVTWLNTALDTSLTFNAQTFSPLQLIDHTIGGVVYKNYLLCEGILEKFTDGTLHKINDPDVLQQMNRLLSLYRTLDSYVFYNDALINNHNAYKYRGANTVIHIEDTIAQGSYFAKKSNLPIAEGPKGHITTLYFDGSCLYPIEFLHFPIPDDIEEFRVDLEFNIYIKNAGDENFWVVTTSPDDEWKSECLDIDKQNQWYAYKHTFKYSKEIWEHFEKDRLLKIFLCNPNKLEGYVDDIKIKVKTL